MVALAFGTGIIGLEIEDEGEFSKSPVSLSGIIEGDAGTATSSESSMERFDDHPGWLWDPNTEEWVPDPEYQE